jgi:DNA-binding transcriptional regulator LsrR (DeoR family)
VPSRKRLQRGAEIWERLVRGDSLDDVTRELGISGADLEQIVQDLVLSESIIVQKVQRNESLEHAVRQAFVDERGQARLRDVWVADLSSIDLAFVRYVLLGYLAKAHFRHEVRPGNSVGLCGGFAVSRMVYALQPGECPGGIRVFPIAVTPVFERATASANSVVSALGYRHFDYGVQASELPFVFEAALEQQPSPPPMRIAKRILDDAAQVDFVFMGIGGRETGALAKDITDFQRDYRWLARLDMDSVKLQGQPVGDIMYHLVDAEGRPLPDFEQQNRELVCSIGLECLRQFVERGKRVVIIAADEDKADVTRAAIVGGYANVLMIDDGLARGLIGRSVRQ